MKHLFIPYELAVIAKEKSIILDGYLGYYSKSHMNDDPRLVKKDWDQSHNGNLNTEAPLYQQIVDWFREKHSLVITIDVRMLDRLAFGHIKYPKHMAGFWTNNDLEPMEYYDAINKAIEEAFKLI